VESMKNEGASLVADCFRRVRKCYGSLSDTRVRAAQQQKGVGWMRNLRKWAHPLMNPSGETEIRWVHREGMSELLIL